MGYEYHVAQARRLGDGTLVLTVENRGVAPFYADWVVEVEAGGEVVRKAGLTAGILPGAPREWSFAVSTEAGGVRLRVPNPMEGGKPLRFANETQGAEWLEIGL